jgi:hypothetical protein
VAFSQDQAAAPWNELSAEAWHQKAYPSTTTFKATDNYSNCDTCMIYGEQCDDMGCNTYFFALGGTGTITQADRNAAGGRMRASASNLRLVEWDFQNDKQVPGARCVEVASATWDVTWSAADGGHD